MLSSLIWCTACVWVTQRGAGSNCNERGVINEAPGRCLIFQNMPRSVSRNKLRFWFNDNRALFFNSAVYYCKQKPLVSNAMLAPDRLISYERARLSILFGCSLQLVWVGVTMTSHVQHQPTHLSAQITQLPSGLMGGQVENWVELGLTQIGREVRFQGCILTLRNLSAATRWRFWILEHCIVLSNLDRRHICL